MVKLFVKGSTTLLVVIHALRFLDNLLVVRVGSCGDGGDCGGGCVVVGWGIRGVCSLYVISHQTLANSTLMGLMLGYLVVVKRHVPLC